MTLDDKGHATGVLGVSVETLRMLESTQLALKFYLTSVKLITRDSSNFDATQSETGD